MAQITNTQSINFGDNNAHCGNIISSFNTYKSDEDAQIMRWLSPLEPKNRHQGVRAERYGNVGGWVLETSEFREWRAGEGRADKTVLFCSGNPGVGKTYLSSLAIDTLCDQATEDTAVACLYYDFLAQQEQTVANVMGAILKQLIGRGDVPRYLRDAFQKGKMEIGGRGLLLADMVRMIRIAITSIPQVFICIDALDECLPKGLPELLESLKDIVRESSGTRIFLTGRPHVREDIQRSFPNAVAIPISPNTKDIRDYVEMRLDRDTEPPKAMNANLREDIVKTMLEKISDIFLLVSLNIDAILGEVTISQRRKKLEEMTRGSGLSDAYTATLSRLKAQNGNKPILGLKVLMWVSHSERPLQAEELCHALGVEMGSADHDPENVPALGTLLASCLGLVTVEASSSTIRLVHFTLQEHLSRNPTLFNSPHSTMAGVCLTYLNFKSVWDLPPTLDSPPSTMPLLDYASCFWGKHARWGMTENAKILALKLLDRYDEHISARLLLLHHNADEGPGLDFDSSMGGPTGFTGLHGLAFFGIADLLAAVFEMKKWKVNGSDSTGSTALTWAAARGHEEVVKTLLERGDVNPNKADTKFGQTPLWLAARRGHTRVVKMLLERGDVNPNQADTRLGLTPLSRAAEYGNEGVVKMLLERGDVNLNRADTECGQTPLSGAARRGRKEVVKMLLERGDINPNQADTKYGKTPLSWAAERGCKEVVKILLQRRDVDPNQADTISGRTPLWLAAGSGRSGVVKMLLKRRDVNPNQVDTFYGRTPLQLAAGCGRSGVVRLLLRRADVDPNQVDTRDGRTPLSTAVICGHEGVVKMLLERWDVNPDQADTRNGQSPLSWAAERGRKEVVKLLLERGDVNPNQADTEHGQTPLSAAASRGHEGVVKMLLERWDIDPNRADAKYCKTPLSWAAEYGHEGVVKILLERGDANPNQPDTKFGRTPLWLAAEHGHEGVVKILLERWDIVPDLADTLYGYTPLSSAVICGHEGVVKMLLERGDINPDQADTKYGYTPLSSAVICGHAGVVQMLLQRGDVDPNQLDTNYGRTPLSWAAEHGHEEAVKMLLERKDVHPATPDYQNQTPLSLALSKGHYGVVRILQDRVSAKSDRANHGS